MKRAERAAEIVMSVNTRRAIQEGIAFGIVAGVVFAVVEMLAAEVMTGDGLGPVRLFASILLGEDALATPSIGVVWLLGGFVHVVLSALFGLIYGVLIAQLTTSAQISWSMHIGVGVVAGFTIWLINFQVIARFAFPWFLDAPQLTQAALHTFAYGLPLGLLYVASERKARGLDLVPHPA